MTTTTHTALVDEAPSTDVLLAEASEDSLSMENGEMPMPLEAMEASWISCQHQ